MDVPQALGLRSGGPSLASVPLAFSTERLRAADMDSSAVPPRNVKPRAKAYLAGRRIKVISEILVIGSYLSMIHHSKLGNGLGVL